MRSKEADSKYRREYAAHPANKLRAKVLERNARHEAKIAVMNMYTNGEATCRHCGQGDIDVLQIDHVNNDGANHRRRQQNAYGGIFLYEWLIRNDYPLGYQVLCANCNIKKEMVRKQDAWEHRIMQQSQTISDAVSLTIK